MNDKIIKGVDSAITIYEVLSRKIHPEKLRGIEGLRTIMIGREKEFAELKGAYEQWPEDNGQIVSLIGEAGLGKSRLVRELIQDSGNHKSLHSKYNPERCPVSC
jgi:predicted Ser/Thr protein kinase